MNNNRHNLIAYLATLGAITLLALAAAGVCLWANLITEVNLARVIGALAFISGAIQGLTGVIGTFRPSNQQNSVPADTADKMLDKVPPVANAAVANGATGK